MSSEIFISEFHNVEGVLIGERKRNIHKLLKNKNITGDEDKLILDNLKPKTYLETLMYVDILIYLRKTVQLLEILKNGHEACVSKIIKQPWFFKEAFNNVGVEEFVNEILPSMSFSVKMKVLNKLSIGLPEEKMDKVFDAILKRYGLLIATSVIPACSSQKIEYILKNNEIKLRTNRLKIIHNKQPDLIKIYLDVHKQLKSKKIFDNNFLIYLAQNDPALFWNVIENCEINDNLKLGRRTTKKLIEIKKSEIISEPKKYIRYFRQETLVRNLNKMGEFKQFYHNLFPRDIEKLESNDVCRKLLKYYPKHSQYQIYSETFSEVLNEKIISNLSCLDDFFFKFIADVEFRETIAQLKYSETNDDEYIQYYKFERCFALIKEKINFTASIKERRKLLCILVKSCAVNKDLKYLQQVLKYFCERHRNDDMYVRIDFLEAIESNFKSEDFDEIHWKYLSEIFKIQSINNEPGQTKLTISYIKYLCKNNRPDDDINYVILEYLKNIVAHNSGGFRVLKDIKDYEIEKKILMQAVEYFPTLMEMLSMKEQTDYYLSVVIGEIFSYNLRHQKNIIVFTEKLTEILRTIFKPDNVYLSYPFEGAFSKVICKLNRNALENEMLVYYWKKSLPQFFVNRVMSWYLKHDPMIITEHIDKVFNTSSPNVASTVWPIIKLYSHLHLDNMVVKHCMKQLDNDEADKDKFVRCLSILAAPEYYIKIIEDRNLIPTSPKLVIQDQEAKNIYKVQRAFVKHFKNLKDPLKYLPVLVDKFCQGDYLQSSLPAVYSAFYKCPECDLKPYLNALSKNPAMSVRKHTLNLACCVFDQKVIFEILNNFEDEKNSSLQKSIFQSCLKYFSKNPSEELFGKVIFHMGFLRGQDKESLNMLHTVNIPINYKPSYIQKVLKLLEKFKDNDKEGKVTEFNNVISSILDLIDEYCIQKLSQVFCREIIQKYFLNNEDIPGIFSFVINVLIYHHEKIDNFDFVFKLLSKYKLQYWHNSSATKERENICKFFRTFYMKAREKEVALDFVEQFSSNWEKIFTPVEAFEEHILLKLLQFKKESEKEPEIYSKKIVLFSEKVVEEFGQIVFSKFVTVLATSLDYEPDERINVLSNMLKFKTTTLNCILVIELIAFRHDLFDKDKIKHMYRDIDSVLRGVSDPKVQLYYNLYLRK